MKNISTLLIALIGLIGNVYSQKIDSSAVFILQKAVKTISSMQSCSFTAYSYYDVASENLGLVKHSSEEKVYMKMPNQMMMVIAGDRGFYNLYYNGTKLCYYSVYNNQYAEMNTSGSIIEMIDNVSRKYGIEFPGADFFYPSFVDDILATSQTLINLGRTVVDGKDCFHIAGIDKDKNYQFWINNDEYGLPVKMNIIYHSADKSPQFEVTYSDWVINPNILSSLFEITIPPKAEKIKFLPKE